MTLQEYAERAIAERRIELQVTGKCNLRCPNCHQLANQLPTPPDLPVGDVVDLFEDSVRQDRPYRLVTVIGGEPTMAPAFKTIVKLCLAYQAVMSVMLHAVTVMVSTNGTVPFWEQEQWLRDQGFADGHFADRVFPNDLDGQPPMVINNSRKDDTHGRNHTSMTFHDPHDTGGKTNLETLACLSPLKCGLSVTHLGVFPCAQAYTMARLTLRPSAIRTMADVTPEALARELEVACAHCGACDVRHGWTPSFDGQFSDFWARKHITRL